jgi:site-specific DNA-methyltransferase (adenine-specific)
MKPPKLIRDHKGKIQAKIYWVYDSLDLLKTMDENSIDSIVTDPPYGISFMGNKWDYDVPSTELWAECLRILKPGGHLLSFAGTRTQHRMAIRIEDAGFEIRDMIAWVYGSGFPKSLDVSKAIDKAAGVEREVVGPNKFVKLNGKENTNTYATEAALQWQGWGTALKPALEPITLARKPLRDTVAANVLQHGAGAINIDGCRVGEDTLTQHGRSDSENVAMSGRNYAEVAGRAWVGRWPANLIHDGSDEVVNLFPESTSGALSAEQQIHGGFTGAHGIYGTSKSGGSNNFEKSSGNASRFFYCAKASQEDRDAGLELHEARQQDSSRNKGDAGGDNPRNRGSKDRQNHHPTVKPTELMRYLVKLVTPPNGIVLDPFMGSGSTGRACMLENFRFIGSERELDYAKISYSRVLEALSYRPTANKLFKLY